MTAADQTELTQERRDLLESLAKHRYLFWGTVEGLTDEQAVATPTASEPVPRRARQARGVHRAAVGRVPRAGPARPRADHRRVRLARREPSGCSTARPSRRCWPTRGQPPPRPTSLLRTVPDLDAAQPLPPAPWNPPGATWTARRVFVHLVAEIAQHAGHADILRETLDGRKSMG
nr:DUF664 domain-containing protein [Angustibacter aerolatus]